MISLLLDEPRSAIILIVHLPGGHEVGSPSKCPCCRVSSPATSCCFSPDLGLLLALGVSAIGEHFSHNPRPEDEVSCAPRCPRSRLVSPYRRRMAQLWNGECWVRSDDGDEHCDRGASQAERGILPVSLLSHISCVQIRSHARPDFPISGYDVSVSQFSRRAL